VTDAVQWGSPEPFTLEDATRTRIVVDTGPVAGDWEVSVAIPSGRRAGDGPFPAVYLLDPTATFAISASIASITTVLSMGALPPIAVVGIGPATDDFARIMVQRNRDLTPTEHEPPAIAGMAGMGTGGAKAFLDLVVDELIPGVEADHPLDPSDRAIGGWSLGGLFTCFALLTRPDAFRRYLAVSPSLWWDSRLLVDAGRVAAADLAGTSVYLGVGELESEKGMERAWPPMPASARETVAGIDMVRDLLDFATLLRDRGDLVIDEVIADESHGTMWPAGVTRGLIALYGNKG
jgi:predicted alpha/beta superfamily hydrolase